MVGSGREREPRVEEQGDDGRAEVVEGVGVRGSWEMMKGVAGVGVYRARGEA